MADFSHNPTESGRPLLPAWVSRAWPAVLGLAIAVTTTWRPGTLPINVAGQRLDLRLPGWIAIALVVAAATICLAIATSLIRPPRHKDDETFVHEPPPPPRLSPLSLVLLLLLLAVAVAGGVVVLHFLNHQHAGSAKSLALNVGPPPPVVQPGTVRSSVHAAAIDRGLTLTLGVAAAIAVGVALLIIAGNEPWWVLGQWLHARRRRKRTLVKELAAVVSAGMRDLEAGDDPRRAVIACYRRCEVTLASRRRRRYPAETPREFVADALNTLQLPVEAVGSLLSVFERARFSNLPITSEDRDRALVAFGGIRSALKQRAEDGVPT
jgi:Domain of unknown function (DUF4129)